MHSEAQSQYSEFKPCCPMQNEAQSQYSEVLLQSQADLSVGQADEGDTDREIRESSQELVEAQQEVMTAQAECDRALRAEQEAFEAWESKRSAYCFWSPPCLPCWPELRAQVSGSGSLYTSSALIVV